MNVSHNDGSCDKRWVINNDISGALLPALVEVHVKEEKNALKGKMKKRQDKTMFNLQPRELSQCHADWNSKLVNTQT